MRLKKVKNSDEIIEISEFIIKTPEEYKGKWKELFNNSNPINIEIGMGKGGFIKKMALKYPDINFIGIERMDSVIARAIQKLDEDIPNLYLIRCDAEKLTDIFSDGEINNIYLNFSDPWPKIRHYKRRLTYKTFLDRYRIILNSDGKVIMKTDNKDLFEYSLESFQENEYCLENVTYDLHKDNDDIVTTEYEEKFLKLGQPIYYLEATLRKK